MDIADDADRECENHLAKALSAAAHRVRPLPAVGACYYCGEDVAGDLRFCDVQCRDDFERERAAYTRAGKG